MGSMLIGALLIAAGFVGGYFVGRNNPLLWDRIAPLMEKKFDELKGKL